MKVCRLYFCGVLTLVAGLSAVAQSYSIDWSVIPGGGGTSTNGQYSLSGSIGQADAGAPMTGGNYSLTGGFWSLISVVQTPGAPMLSINRSGNQVTVSWPVSSSSWTLQQNSDLGNAAGWSDSGLTVSTNSGLVSAIVTAPAGNLFFRLSSQP